MFYKLFSYTAHSKLPRTYDNTRQFRFMECIDTKMQISHKIPVPPPHKYVDFKGSITVNMLIS